MSTLCCFKRKTAYEVRISDWSSYVCSSDLGNSGLFDFYRAELEIHDPSGQLLAGDRLALTGQDMTHQMPGVSDHFAGLATLMLVGQGLQIGRELCRERVCQYVKISGVGVALKTKSVKQNTSVA